MVNYFFKRGWISKITKKILKKIFFQKKNIYKSFLNAIKKLINKKLFFYEMNPSYNYFYNTNLNHLMKNIKMIFRLNPYYYIKLKFKF